MCVGICGATHVHHNPQQRYRAVEVASEPITDESWLEIPDGAVFTVDADMRLRIEPMGECGLTAANAAPLTA